jgi:iron complex outermembrane receptor protein
MQHLSPIALSAVLACAPAVAQVNATSPAGLAPVIVTGNPLRTPGLAAPVSVLAGDDLVRQRRGSLGETLDGLPGVSQTWFGPGSSRPTIRGFDGERVRVLGNGRNSVDASTLSFDHAVPIDPLIVQRVEVLRGPAALAYGGSAIGGVVNAIDNRIPRESLSGLGGAGEVRFGGAARERGGAAIVEAGQSGVVLHVDAFGRDTEDLRVPRFTPVIDGVSQGETRRIANSSGRTSGAAIGGAFFTDQLRLGASIDQQDNRYGIVVEPDVFIRMQRQQAALEAEWRAGGSAIRALRGTVHFSRYRHEEVEGTGEVGTTFRSRSTEWRLEAEHAPWAGWSGVLGLHLENVDFSALGEEAFVPGTSTRRTGFYVIEEFGSAWGTTRAGVRLDRAKVGSDGDADPVAARFGQASSKRFNLVNASVSQVAPLGRGLELAASASLTQRAPADFELYADGVHLATAAYERGDPTLPKERGRHADLTLRWSGPPHAVQVSVWTARFDNYIALESTGVDISVPDEAGGTVDFPEYVFRAVPARWVGAEASGRWRLMDSPGQVDLTGQLDATRATNTATDQPLPRLAAWRSVLGLDARRGPWAGRLEWVHTGRQSRVPPGEAAVEGFDRLNLVASREWTVGASRGLWFVRLDNLTDALGFNAASVDSIRSLAPLPGRSLKAGVQVEL